MVLVTDLKGRIVCVNPAVQVLLGYRPEEMVGKKASVFFRGIPGNPPDLAREMADNHGPDGVWRGVILNRKKDGSTIDVHLSLSELRDQKGRLSGYVGVSRNVSLHKEMERELKRTNRHLRILDRKKSVNLSLVSHELRTPLASLRSFAEILLEDETISADRRREFISIIRDDTDRLTRLINNILDLGQIEAGQMIWEDSLFNLPDRIEKAVRALEVLALSRKVTIEMARPEDPLFVKADPDRIQQVAINLLSNALAVSPPGESVRVEVSLARGGGRVRVAVTDRGDGIEKSDWKKIFRSFYRKDKQKQGIGLGLSISREIIRHYRGSIGVEQSSPQGTTISFLIPKAKRTR